MARTLFSWIHLSDIHFGHGATSYQYDQKLVLERLRKDLDDARKETGGPPQHPDAIFVTGDIAFSGGARDPKEYTDAKAWLLDMAASVGLGAGQVFVVPGNHDVDRNTSVPPDLVPKLRDGRMAVDDALAQTHLAEALVARMGAYLSFASDFAPRCLGTVEPYQLFWAHHLDNEGLHVRIAGLNTALLCAGDDDAGKLRLGRKQILATLLKPPAEGELIIALTHHPLRGWLEDEDARYAELYIKNNVHVHLFGHVHEQETEGVRGGGAQGSMVRVVAGACHNERQPQSWIPAGHGYNWGAVVADDEGNVTLRVWPRRWSDKNTDFRLDTNVVPRDAKYAVHTLSSVKLAKRASQATTPSPPVTTAPTGATPDATAARAAKPPTVEVFYFYAPEDETLLRALDTHLALLRKSRVITSFSKQAIGAGEKVAEEVRAHVESAKVFLALLTPTFLASDDFDGPEMTRILDRVDEGSAVLIPIFFKPFDLWDNPIWTDSRMQKLQGLPKAKHSTKMSWVVEKGNDIDEELTAVVRGVRERIAKL